MAVQDRQMITRLRSHIEQEKLPLDKDSKKDLETHHPVDVLEDRSAETFAQWLRLHPGVEYISRDRSKDYQRGATDGAPAARTASLIAGTC